MKIFIFITLLIPSSIAFANQPVTVKSKYSHAKTVDLLEKAIASKKLTLFTKIEHHLGAKKVGLELRPTSLIIFGNPKVGTPIMLENQMAGLTLPMKLLVYDDPAGTTYVAYNKPTEMQQDLKLETSKPITEKMTKALESLVASAQ